jgi:DNA polymerase III subunit delta'
MWKTVGHEQVKSVLERQLEAEQLFHAYLFLGGSGVGKALLARDFARKVIHAENVDVSFDFVEVNSNDLDVKGMREFLSGINKAPISSKYFVVLIREIDKLNVHSLNTLLKNLEEPPEHTMYIMTSDAEEILQTVMSRCQVFRFGKLSDAELKDFAQNKRVDVVGEMIQLSFGNPSRLLRFSEDKTYYNKERESLTLLESLRTAHVSDRILTALHMAETEVEDVVQTFTFWVNFLKYKSIITDKVAHNISVLEKASQKLAKTFNKKMVLEQLFLSLK